MIATSVFAGESKISGLTYFNYTYNSDDDAVNGFGLNRVYFTYQNEISEGIKYKFQTDIDYKSSPMNVYLKNAKIDWQTQYGKVTLGLQGMNVFSIQEKTWGYRYIDKSPMDLHKWSSSADMGIGYSNKLMDKLNFSILYTNGAGYKKSENDSNKKLSIQVSHGERKLVSKDGFNIGAIFTHEPYDFEVDTVKTILKKKTVLGLFAGFSGMGIRIGAEFDRMKDDGSDVTKQIGAIYGRYQLSDDIEVFGLYDLYDPNTDENDNNENYIIAGFSYSPGKGLIIAPNIRYISYEDDTDSKTLYVVNIRFKF